MQFHAEFFPKILADKIQIQHPVMLMGSCFTDQIGNKLLDHKFKILQNPNGILFNPVSISRAIQNYIGQKKYTEADLFYYNELWHSWDHHSRFSSPDKTLCIDELNQSQKKAYDFLLESKWLIITLGSAFVYERKEVDDPYLSVAANCHKIPNDTFNRRLMDSAEVTEILKKIISLLQQFNKDLKIIFTISPVRHLREGFIENNRSKAALIEAVHKVSDHVSVLYFPSYELIIDDLRDYRFYAEDLVHPNYSATNYVWEKFVESCIEPASQSLMKELAVILAARNHKPFNKDSDAHKKFRKKNLDHILKLKQEFPFLDFYQELIFFEK